MLDSPVVPQHHVVAIPPVSDLKLGPGAVDVQVGEQLAGLRLVEALDADGERRLANRLRREVSGWVRTTGWTAAG